MKIKFHTNVQMKFIDNKLAAIAVTVAALTMTSCGNSEISAVKDSYIDEGMTMTTSQLLDNRKICDDIEWDSVEDENRRKVVEYKCTFRKPKKTTEKKREEYINAQRTVLEEEINKSNEEIRKYETLIEKQKNNGATNVEKRIETIQPFPEKKSEYAIKLMAVSDQLNKVKNNYTDDDYINLLESNDFKYLLREFRPSENTSREQNRMLREFEKYIGPLISQLGWMREEKTAAAREEYKRDNVDKYLKPMRDNIENLSIYFSEKITEYNQQLEQQKVDHLADIESKRNELYESIEINIKGYEHMMGVVRQSIAADQQKLQALEDNANSLYPQYKEIAEKFQWIVNNDGRATPIYGELVATSLDNNTKPLVKHTNPQRSFLLMSKIQTDDLDEYLQKFSSLTFWNTIYN